MKALSVDLADTGEENVCPGKVFQALISTQPLLQGVQVFRPGDGNLLMMFQFIAERLASIFSLCLVLSSL